MATDANVVVQNQKKRTLEALERRFAVAKAELLQQNQKNKTPSQEEGRGKGHNNNYTSIASPMCETDESGIPSSKKGHFAFSSRTSSRGTLGISDVEANGPTYFRLSQPVHENLLSTGVKLSNSKGSMADKIVHELLQNGDVAPKYMQGSRSIKIDNWLLLDNFVQGRGTLAGARIRALQSHSKRFKRHISMKQHKKCGSFDLPQEVHNFDFFKPMHEMWKNHVMQLLKKIGESQLVQCLLTDDLHGAIFTVAECEIASFTGVSGIMIRETAQTFGIITEDNRFRVVPKKASVFIFQADCWKITLHGDKLNSRNL